MQKMPPPAVHEHIPHLAFDSVIFGFSGTQLKILIMEYHNTNIFALPGGFVRKNEHLNDAVRRGLKERTGLDNIHLEQFYTFGDADRKNPGTHAHHSGQQWLSPENHRWMLDRFISVAYYALINYQDVVPQPDALSDSCQWYNIDALPPADDGSSVDCGKSPGNLAQQPGSKIGEGQYVATEIHHERIAKCL